jgi:RNA polymerase sigma-70 factor (ECF subfamily)
MADGQAEFRDLYDVHVDFVWRCLRRLGIREADLMDSTQKVFLTAYLKLPEFEGRSALSSWLFAICQRVAGDYRRSAPIRREVATDGSLFEMAATAGDDDPAQQSESREHAVVAEEMLAKLPEAQRTAFLLFEVEGLSGQEIADALGVSLGTVRSRLRLAREAFRRELKRRSAGSAREAV